MYSGAINYKLPYSKEICKAFFTQLIVVSSFLGFVIKTLGFFKSNHSTYAGLSGNTFPSSIWQSLYTLKILILLLELVYFSRLRMVLEP